MHNDVVMPDRDPPNRPGKAMSTMAKTRPKRGDTTDAASVRREYESLSAEIEAQKAKTKQLRARKRDVAARLAEITSRTTSRAILEILGPRMASRGFDLQGVLAVLADIDETGLDRDAIRARIRGEAVHAAAPGAGSVLEAPVAAPPPAETASASTVVASAAPPAAHIAQESAA